MTFKEDINRMRKRIAIIHRKKNNTNFELLKFSKGEKRFSLEQIITRIANQIFIEDVESALFDQGHGIIMGAFDMRYEPPPIKIPEPSSTKVFMNFEFKLGVEIPEVKTMVTLQSELITITEEQYWQRFGFDLWLMENHSDHYCWHMNRKLNNVQFIK